MAPATARGSNPRLGFEPAAAGGLGRAGARALGESGGDCRCRQRGRVGHQDGGVSGWWWRGPCDSRCEMLEAARRHRHGHNADPKSEKGRSFSLLH
uniref:Uncharacterized protein n=1 Tax=Oryza barthii TaxID=65489 RepID=A0A0D3ESV1_9ORYZ